MMTMAARGICLRRNGPPGGATGLRCARIRWGTCQAVLRGAWRHLLPHARNGYRAGLPRGPFVDSVGMRCVRL